MWWNKKKRYIGEYVTILNFNDEKINVWNEFTDEDICRLLSHGDYINIQGRCIHKNDILFYKDLYSDMRKKIEENTSHIK